MLYSVSAAIALILVIGIAVFWHSRSQNTDEEGTVPTPAATQAPAQPCRARAGAFQQQAATPAPAQPTAAAEPEAAPPEPVVEPHTSRKAAAAAAKGRNAKNKKNAASPPALIPGHAVVDSTPEGAQVQVDGRGDPSWVTPYTITNLSPGQHTFVISNAGFGQETRMAEVASAAKTSLSVDLAALVASIAATSDPPGALIFVDSKDTLRVTPSQITLETGIHTILVRKAGYLDETSSATAQPGQALKFSPTLRALGNAEDIRPSASSRSCSAAKAIRPAWGR